MHCGTNHFKLFLAKWSKWRWGGEEVGRWGGGKVGRWEGVAAMVGPTMVGPARADACAPFGFGYAESSLRSRASSAHLAGRSRELMARDSTLIAAASARRPYHAPRRFSTCVVGPARRAGRSRELMAPDSTLIAAASARRPYHAPRRCPTTTTCDEMANLRL